MTGLSGDGRATLEAAKAIADVYEWLGLGHRSLPQLIRERVAAAGPVPSPADPGDCTAAVNQRGEHIPCHGGADHSGWPHSNEAHGLVWDENEPQKAAEPLPDELLKTRAQYRYQLRCQLEVVARATPNLIAENLLDAWNERDEARMEVARLRASRDAWRTSAVNLEREVALLREQHAVYRARVLAALARFCDVLSQTSVTRPLIPAVTLPLASLQRAVSDD